MAVGKAFDPKAWAASQERTIGRRCSICAQPEAAEVVRVVCEEWAAGRAPNVSWPKLAALVRDRFGTRTSWESIRNHVVRDLPKIAKALRGTAL